MNKLSKLNNYSENKVGGGGGNIDWDSSRFSEGQISATGGSANFNNSYIKGPRVDCKKCGTYFLIHKDVNLDIILNCKCGNVKISPFKKEDIVDLHNSLNNFNSKSESKS